MTQKSDEWQKLRTIPRGRVSLYLIALIWYSLIVSFLFIPIYFVEPWSMPARFIVYPLWVCGLVILSAFLSFIRLHALEKAYFEPPQLVHNLDYVRLIAIRLSHVLYTAIMFIVLTAWAVIVIAVGITFDLVNHWGFTSPLVGLPTRMNFVLFFFDQALKGALIGGADALGVTILDVVKVRQDVPLWFQGMLLSYRILFSAIVLASLKAGLDGLKWRKMVPSRPTVVHIARDAESLTKFYTNLMSWGAEQVRVRTAFDDRSRDGFVIDTGPKNYKGINISINGNKSAFGGTRFEATGVALEIDVNGIETVIAHAVAMGGSLVQGVVHEENGTWAMIKDPEGNLIMLGEDKPLSFDELRRFHSMFQRVTVVSRKKGLWG